jgi:3-hydroxybutyryl-CoA dehydrogenase
VKRTILELNDTLIRSDTNIASTTSSGAITKLAPPIFRPDPFVGMRFFNPVPVMALVEIVRGRQAGHTNHGSVAAIATKLGKIPITVTSSPVFAVNRILLPMLNEDFFVLGEEIAGLAEIDDATKLRCNLPTALLALANLIGLHSLLSVTQRIRDELSNAE